MPVTSGDWIEDFATAGTSREVAAREIAYELRAVSGLTATLQALVGTKWQAVEVLTAAGPPKSWYSLAELRFRMVLTGTGTATIVLSPDNPVPG